MKRKSLLFVWSYVFILSTIFISCKDTDNSVFGDDFDFPALTDANTIRFTVNVTGDWQPIEHCCRRWTNGNRLGKRSNAKVEDPSSMAGGVTYRYGNKGSYNVRIWAEELQLIDISGLLISISDLHLGNMPGMKSLVLNSITDTRELNLNTFCPNVESINIGSSQIWNIWRLSIVPDYGIYKFILILN